MPTEMTEEQHVEIDVDVHRLVFGGGVEEGYEFVVPRYSRPSDIGKVISYMCRKGFTFVVTPMRQSPSYAANFIGEPNTGTRISYVYSHDVLEVAVCLSALKVAREHPGWPNCRGSEQPVLVSNGSNGWGGHNWVARQGAMPVSEFAFSGTVTRGGMVATRDISRPNIRGWDGRNTGVPRRIPVSVAVYKNGLLQSPLDFNTATDGFLDEQGIPSGVRIAHRDGVYAVVEVGQSWSYQTPDGNRYVFTVADREIHPPDVRPIRLLTESEERRLYAGLGASDDSGGWRTSDDGRSIDRVCLHGVSLGTPCARCSGDDADKLVRHPSVGEGEET